MGFETSTLDYEYAKKNPLVENRLHRAGRYKPRMSQSKQNLEDVEFITERVIYFLKLTQNPVELRKHFETNRMDGLCSLNHPERGMMICGLDANNRFYQIARRWLASQNSEKAKTHLEDLVKALKDCYVQKFLVKEDEMDESNVQQMFSRAYKSIMKKRQSLTHFIPCVLFSDKEPQSFHVGPVEFLRKEEFRLRYHDQVEASRERIKVQHQERVKAKVDEGTIRKENAMTESDSADFSNRMVDNVIDFYYDYNWIAVTSVGPCDNSISHQKALRVVNGALNVLKLLFGRHHTNRIRVAYSVGVAKRSATLTQCDDDKLMVSSSFGGGDDNSLGDGWLEILTQQCKYHFEQASKALSLSMDFECNVYLAPRFMDALRWYGDAVTESDPAYQIVKYISALERLTGTGVDESRGVTDIVTTRTAMLYSDTGKMAYESAIKQIKELYGLRSDLLHGSISPFDSKISSFTEKAHDVVQNTLLMGLSFYELIGLDREDMNETKLGLAFKEFESQHS